MFSQVFFLLKYYARYIKLIPPLLLHAQVLAKPVAIFFIVAAQSFPYVSEPLQISQTLTPRADPLASVHATSLKRVDRESSAPRTRCEDVNNGLECALSASFPHCALAQKSHYCKSKQSVCSFGSDLASACNSRPWLQTVFLPWASDERALMWRLQI